MDDIKSFLKEIEHKTGAQLFVLTAFEKVDGSVAITKYEISKAIITFIHYRLSVLDFKPHIMSVTLL